MNCNIQSASSLVISFISEGPRNLSIQLKTYYGGLCIPSFASYIRVVHFFNVIFSSAGMSFMLHQIRKMIALVIAIRQGLASINFIPQALSRDHASLPIAPGLGLVLENQHFDNYNRMLASKSSAPEVCRFFFTLSSYFCFSFHRFF